MQPRPLALLIALWFFCVALPVPSASAQTVEAQIRDMRLEMQRLRDELEGVKAELRRLNAPTRPVLVASTELRGPLPDPEQIPAQAAPGEPQDLTPDEALPLIREQLQEQARTKVEANSKFPMKLFGTIVSNTFLNTGEPNWLDIGNVVTPTPAGLPAGSFSSTLRQTRLGAILDGPQLGSMKTSALVAMDFFGGIPNFQTGQVQPVPRLVYAYMRMETPRTAIQIGQDHMILAPKNPTSLTGLAFPILFRAGNLYLRVPQIRAERTLASGGFGEIRAVGGILAPIGGDASTAAYLFVPPNLAGERSARPGVQSRLSWRAAPAGPYEEPAWEFGASGHYSRERYATGINPSWARSVDFDVTAGRFGIGGELFDGKNIDAFGASLAQVAKSRGGFIEARVAATRRLDFNGGYGTDRLYDRVRFPGNLVQNASIFANTIYQLTPELGLSFEYRWLETTPRVGAPRPNRHFDFTAAYSF